MKHRLAFLILILALCAGALPAHAQRVSQLKGGAPSGPSGMGSRIVAVVNDNVITSSDLSARIGMALLSSGLPNTPEVRNRLAAQLLRVMIDEQLQMQEAKKLDIKVSPDEVDKAMNKIAMDNHIPGADMKAFLQSHKVPPEALAQQIRAGLSWNRVIQRELRPRVDIGDDEIESVIERTRANAGKQEFLVSEIFLSVDNPKDDDQVKQLGSNLVQQLKQGTSFGAIARQFSQSASAAAGGDIGWIQEGQLAPELNKVLTDLLVGTISDPIRAASGYYIFGLREKRTVTLGGASSSGASSVNLQQVYKPFDIKNRAALLKEADQLRTAVKSCGELKPAVSSKFPSWQWQDLGEVKLAGAPPWLADKVRNLPVNSSSEAMATGKGALIVFICGRKANDDKIDRDAIMNQIGTEKLELQARGLLRDLRRDAYLDVRLN